jgi:hypothetical protein
MSKTLTGPSLPSSVAATSVPARADLPGGASDRGEAALGDVVFEGEKQVALGGFIDGRWVGRRIGVESDLDAAR